MARLDAELVSRAAARSRERAKEMIRSGGVKVNGAVITKPSAVISEGDEIEILEADIQYVGRGALKLEKAADEFELSFEGKICLDIGASTGGFTDFMLRNGASRVYAVDVGHGQLAPSLRTDSRVINAEGTDIREITAEFTGGEVDFISADVSFISLKKIIPKMYELLKPDACAAVLIKPQFEAGRENIGKKGIVKDRRVHARILQDIDCFAASVGFCAEKYTYSPVKGGSGNIEYLVKLVKSEKNSPQHNFRELAERAFNQL